MVMPAQVAQAQDPMQSPWVQMAMQNQMRQQNAPPQMPQQAEAPMPMMADASGTSPWLLQQLQALVQNDMQKKQMAAEKAAPSPTPVPKEYTGKQVSDSYNSASGFGSRFKKKGGGK